MPGTPSGTTALSTKASRISIPVYAQQNKEYHDTQVIDIMTGTKNGTKVDPLAVGDSSTAVFGTDKPGSRMNAGPSEEMKEQVTEESRSQRFIKALIFVVLLVFVGTISVILIRKRTTPDELL